MIRGISRAAVGSLLVILVGAVLPSPAVALTEFEEDWQVRTSVTGNLLPEAARSAIAAACPQFAGTFEIYVYWPVTDVEQSWAFWPWPFYGQNGILAFANAVMPAYVSGSDMYASSLMRRVCLYFGNDFSTAYYPFSVYNYYSGGDQRLSAFDIDILPSGGDAGTGYGVNDRGILFLPLPAGPVGLDRMANDGFAHEWLQMIESSNHPHWCCDLGDDTQSEYWAQCSEYLNGWFWLNQTDPSTRTELPFSRGIMAGDYYEACGLGANEDQLHKHMTYSMFAPYLFEHYSLGELYTQEAMHSWIQQKLDPEQEGDWPTRTDLKGLGTLLATVDYNPFFDSQGDVARVRELFQEYALSLWVNEPGLLGEDFPRSEASVWASGASPSGTHGYMVDFDGNCTDDVHTLPLYNIVTATHQNKDDWITLRDLYPDSPSCYGQPPYPRRPLQVSTYGYNVLPFVADPAIQDEALAYDLRVDVSVDDRYWCELANDDVDAELTDNEVLHFYVLGYPEATSALHEAGDEAELINTYEFSSFDSNPTPTLSFSVGRFGVRYKSVVLLMTLTEKALENGPRTAKVLPFDYSYWAEGNTVPITTDTYWPSAGLIHDGIVSLNGEVTVQGGAKLTIMPGTQVFCADRAAVPGGVVGFDVQGVLQIGSPSGSTVHVEPAEGSWTGIGVANYAGLSIFSADISGFSEISAGSNATVDIWASNFELADEAAGYAFAGAGSAEVADCQFKGAGVFTLGGSAQVGPHSLASSQFVPLEGEEWGVNLILENDAVVNDVEIAGSGPIRCNDGQITLSSVSATGYDLISFAPQTGILISGDAEVLVEDSYLSAFDHAIGVHDASKLTLRRTYLEGMQVGVMLNTTQVADLGHDGSASEWGNNCFDMAAGYTCRTCRLSRSNYSAERNYWGVETPPGSFFCGGGVDYLPHLTECSLDPPGGGGQFSFGVVPSSGTADEGLKLTIYPNPGNPSFAICALLPATGQAFSLAVYDVAGRLVKELAAGSADGREHQATWDGADELGHPSGSGVYFVRVRVGVSTATTQKLILVR